MLSFVHDGAYIQYNSSKYLTKWPLFILDTTQEYLRFAISCDMQETNCHQLAYR
jgi:hypothetical protein